MKKPKLTLHVSAGVATVAQPQTKARRRGVFESGSTHRGARELHIVATGGERLATFMVREDLYIGEDVIDMFERLLNHWDHETAPELVQS